MTTGISVLLSAVDKVTGPLKNIGTQVSVFQEKIEGASKRMKSQMETSAYLSLAGNAANQVINVFSALSSTMLNSAAGIETAATQFKVLTGSMENATKLVTELQELGAKTPLEFGDISETTKRLMAFGVSQKEVVNTVRMLGDAALGDAKKLDSLSRAYGKVRASGKVSMEEINMTVDAGVPILKALSQVVGVDNVAALRKLITQGKVTSAQFNQAFVSMTSAGGQFYKGMEENSQTFSGLMSTMKDNMNLLGATIGKSVLPEMKFFTKIISDISGWLTDLNTKHPLLAKGIAIIVFGLTGLATIIGPLITLISAVSGTMALMSAAGITLGAAMAFVQATILPIIAIIAGVALAAFLIIRYWKQISGFFVWLWETVSGAFVKFFKFLWGLLDNKWIQLALAYFAPFIGIPIMIIKNWKSITSFFSNLWGGIVNIFMSAVEKIVGILPEPIKKLFGIGGATVNVNSSAAGNPARNPATTSIMYKQSTERQEVTVKFDNAPRGTRLDSSKALPGLDLSMGYANAGL